MADKLKPGEKVYVPRVLVNEDQNHPSAFYYAEVAEVTKTPTFKIYLKNGSPSSDLHAKFAHRSLRVVLLTVGDYETEHSLLKNLSNSIHSYFKLLLPDDELRAYSLRTKDELQSICHREIDLTSHVVIIGHGGSNSIRFGHTDLSASEILPLLGISKQPKQVLSLCCKTGSVAFGQPFSKTRKIIQSFVAPDAEVQGAIASQFCQTYFAEQFLRGLASRNRQIKVGDITARQSLG